MSMFANAQLPDGWKLTPIRTAFKTTEKPRGLSPANYESVPFIPMDAVPIAGWDVYPPEVRPGSEISSGTYCEDGDLLLAKITPSFENGKQAFAALDGAKFAYGTTEVIPLQAIPDQGVIEYLYSVLLHPGLRASLAGKMEGSTGRQRLGKEVLLSTPIPMPTPDEQRKIARVLATVQRAIEQQQAIIATTRELKRSLMHKLFTEGLRGETQKPTEIGLVPKSWEVKRIGEIATLKSGGTPSRSNESFWIGGTIPWVKTGEVDYCVINDTEEKITQEGLDGSSAKIFPAGTLLMAMYGQGITRGKVGILGVDAATNQACAAFFPKEEVRTGFLYQLFSFKYDYIRNLGHGANQKNLSADILKTVQIAYPKDTDEQDEIVSSLSALDDKLALAERKRSHFEDLFKTLLHQLMTAQLRVNDLDLDTLGVPPLD
ncbi:restriction endonuclease subunit S [Pseudomonas sp. LjRoot71]|nr:MULTISPECIES: restriction endonuclease subunit S [Pseudomonas]MBO8313458.1 restriction endonuclease subunit S [Pseudomonas aeruginosa]MBO8328360.1 restriction endonuclease subunit S [Pseudomonas aeruginosa]MBO8379756.1 restriction endonuclease subunit S [Pseudomonas aeruginosa]MBO8393071.1 restriction endonuclease subunit S [Pseudomonas aeruginosa]MBS9743303.1 restriction endonuclease subunit S [Pseudomonas aeruginosa]